MIWILAGLTFLCSLKLLCNKKIQVLNWLQHQHDDESKEHHWFRSRMGIYAERDNKVKEHSWRETWATVQLRRLHDALYVCCFFCSPLLSHLYNSILVPFGKLRLMPLTSLSCFLFVICRTIYNMCTQKPPHDYSQQLYDKYRESFEDYIASTVRVITFFRSYFALNLHIT